MYMLEIMVLLISCFFSYKLLVGWYHPIAAAWPRDQRKAGRWLLGLLPVVSLVVIIFVLRVLASFDVVNDLFYILFYIALGFAWQYMGTLLMFCLFDISWLDDALVMDNKAALSAVTGGFLAVTVIYSGANIGDGPGWWCVIFAGLLGLSAWIGLSLLINLCTGVFERITVERDTGSGIRFGSYLLASGLILGRASAGDWTSFGMTVVEFLDGWPVLLLSMLSILVELLYRKHPQSRHAGDKTPLLGSVLWAAIFIIFAAASVLFLPPLRENPSYGSIRW
ncbi:hypothetical protein [Breznakiella homolactica]|uniref:Uncharacterized protein n=1 Tax=Breznakiella homolactica TaxID=2798577 RepID=A0A7T8BA29_9SPIR|nr:hypothetical protein [Breznakiella homolactica]QQO07803.1 hypothetical protein JFL75_12730 [Breznakiella homolactica]